MAAGDEGGHEEGGAHAVLPPPMKLLPRHWPDWRVKGARPASAAIWLRIERSKLRHLGDEGARDDWADAGNGGEKIFVRPPHRRAPDAGHRCRHRGSLSSFCRAVRSRSMLCCRLRAWASPALAFGDDHVDDLAAAGDQIGEQAGWHRGNGPHLRAWWLAAKRAITAASMGSVLARLPSAWAKARTCAGLTTTTGSPAAARARRDHGLEAAGGLDGDRIGSRSAAAARAPPDPRRRA